MSRNQGAGDEEKQDGGMMLEVPRAESLVIGAGPSGLTTMKSLLEKGLHVRIYEAPSHIGGAFTSVALSHRRTRERP